MVGYVAEVGARAEVELADIVTAQIFVVEQGLELELTQPLARVANRVVGAAQVVEVVLEFLVKEPLAQHRL
jgi:hypothetical protein